MLINTPQSAPSTVDPYSVEDHEDKERTWLNSIIACKGAEQLLQPDVNELPELEGLTKFIEPHYLWKDGEDFEDLKQINGTCWADDRCWYNTCDNCENVNDLGYQSAKYCVKCHLLLCRDCYSCSSCKENRHEVLDTPDDLGIGPLMNYLALYRDVDHGHLLYVNGDQNSPYFGQILLQLFDHHGRFGLYRVGLNWRIALNEMDTALRQGTLSDYVSSCEDAFNKAMTTCEARNADGRATTYVSYYFDQSILGFFAAKHGVMTRNYG